MLKKYDDSNFPTARYNEFENTTEEQEIFGKTDNSWRSDRPSNMLTRTLDVFPHKPQKRQRGLVEIERQLPRDRHDYIEYANNKPHENRFNMPTDRSAIDKTLAKNILMHKMIDREQRNVKTSRKTGNLDYQPNFMLIKPKNSYGPNFTNYMQTEREFKSTKNLKDRKVMKYNDFFNTNANPKVSTASNFRKMLGRSEVMGGKPKVGDVTANNRNQSFSEKLFRINPQYTRREPHHKLDIECILQNN